MWKVHLKRGLLAVVLVCIVVAMYGLFELPIPLDKQLMLVALISGLTLHFAVSSLPPVDTMLPPPFAAPAGFNNYRGKSVTRVAYEVKSGDSLTPCVDVARSLIDIGGSIYSFAHFEKVSPGDYIIFNGMGDIYHCRRDVFLERNHV